MEDLGARMALTGRRARMAIGGIVAFELLVTAGGVLLVRALLAFRQPFASVAWWRGAFTWPFWITAAILYCRWLHRAYADQALLGGRPLRFSPTYAWVSFFVPIVNLWQPYQALRDLYWASDPNRLPDPPRYKPASEVLYRSSAREVVSSPSWRKWCPLRSWWALYMIVPLVTRTASFFLPFTSLGGSYELNVGLMSGLSVASSLCSLISAVLAVQVIRAIQARQRELMRRVEASQGQAPAS